MGDVSDWVIVGLTGLALAGGLAAWFLTQLKELKTDMRAEIAKVEADIKNDLKEETRLREEADAREIKLREEAMARVERQVEGFGQVATAVVKMGSAVEHLTEKFGDHQRSQDRALDELKHSIRTVESSIRSIRTAGRARGTLKGTT